MRDRAIRSRVLLLGVACAIAGACSPGPSLLAQDIVAPCSRRFWTESGVAFGAALLADGALRRFMTDHQSRALDRVAGFFDPYGRAEFIVPTLIATAVIPRFVHDRPLADAALRVGLGYAAADLAGGAMRVVIARHRPDSTGDPWRFRPFRPQRPWGSMPSAHVTHAFAIAAGVAGESSRPWLVGLGYGIASLVAIERVYRQAHWSSDVVAGAAISISVSGAVRRLTTKAQGGPNPTPTRSLATLAPPAGSLRKDLACVPNSALP